MTKTTLPSALDGPAPPAVRIAASTKPLAPPAMSMPASPTAVTPEGTTFADGVTLPISPDGANVLVSGPDGSVSIVPIAGGPPRPLSALLAATLAALLDERQSSR